MLVVIPCAKSQTNIDTTCIKTEQLRKILKDAKKSQIQEQQIDILKQRILNDSTIIRNDSVIIENKTREIAQKEEEIEDLNRSVKMEKLKKQVWKASSGLLGLICIRLIFKN